MARRRRKKLSLWAAEWGGIARCGRRRTKTITFFTLAVSREEAIETMRDGLMGYPGVEGSNVEPERVYQLTYASNGWPAGDLLKRGEWFIAPYRHLTRGDIVELVRKVMIRN
jgi:hypothetical protein